jgi:alanyl-tRNA synthetase
MPGSLEIRESFLRFFEEMGHRRVSSHSLVPPADPTLLFVNAGMVQFKDIFTGDRKVDFSRATTSQKCLRVSGKHNDLENVGRTARHHTFFEMLGNFSFGDYFKEEAINFAYEYLVKRVGLDPDKLYYTVFGGDPADNLGADEEAAGMWMRVAGVPAERILRFGKKDNFWAMGDTGPCGPCSEIIYDRGPGPWACGKPECAPGCDCDRYMEIWNLVFMQFRRDVAGGPLTPLPRPSIDTGMGLERLCSVLQVTPTNYETDLFLPYIQFAIKLLAEETGLTVEYHKNPDQEVALRVIADHARTAAFLTADQVYPDNEGRGYIARLIMRRAIRFGKMLGFKEPFLHKVCGQVVDNMAAAYPELNERRNLIDKVVLQEERAFGRTYEDGRLRLEKEMQRLGAEGKASIPGEFVFWLHDERGFPPDLTALIASDGGFGIDREAYEAIMDSKRAASTGGVEGASHIGGDANLGIDLPATAFVGYEHEESSAKVLAVLDASCASVKSLAQGQEGSVILDQSPFYAESGGQVADHGAVVGNGGKALVTDTRRTKTGVFLHRVTVEAGTLSAGDTVKALVAAERRHAISRHHTATHLLHQALGQILGEHVKQEGSLVTDEFLRFDFRHFNALTHEEIEKIQLWINERVLRNQPVITEELGMKEAVAKGAKAFFGDKYGERVRMVTSAGGESIELCGGVHVKAAGDLGAVIITKQEAVSSGVRRIYAVAGLKALEYISSREALLRHAAAELRTPPENVGNRVVQLLKTVTDLEGDLEKLKAKLLNAGSGGDAVEEKDVGGVKLMARLLQDADMGAARQAADLLRSQHQDSAVLVGAQKDGKLVFVVACGGVADGKVNCGSMCKELTKITGGKGGGSCSFAQAGGADPSTWPQIKEVFFGTGASALQS